MRARRATGGFTLVELLVALALAAVISISIMFISTQAREAYEATVKKVDVYNRLRYAFQSIESDLKQWMPTGDLEFYADGRGQGRVNFHWDPGEELPDEKDAENRPGVLDGGQYGAYDEFAYILERHYLSRELGQSEQKSHDAYQVYFRTMTYVDGGVRMANVEYMLADPLKPFVNGVPQSPDNVEPNQVANLSVYKIIRYQDVNSDIVLKQTKIPVRRKMVEIATNVTDFRIEYTVENRYVNRQVNPGFRTPEGDFAKPVEPVTRPRLESRPDGTKQFRKFFGYGSVKLDVKFPLATAEPAQGENQGLARSQQPSPVRFGFRGNPDVSFAELTPGDQIFIFTGSSRGEVLQGGATGNTGRLIRFPSGNYGVKTNFNGLLEFEEDLDSSTWKSENQTGIYYKAGFLPSAVRVTIRIVDDKGENPKTLQREIWLRRRSR